MCRSIVLKSGVELHVEQDGVLLGSPCYDAEWSDCGREATLAENLFFNNIIMDGIYGRPIEICVSESDKMRCDAIRNIHFSNMYAEGLEFPYLKGTAIAKLQNIQFDHCRFERVDDDQLPNYHQHGAAAWGREPGAPMISYAGNVTFNNTAFVSCQA